MKVGEGRLMHRTNYFSSDSITATDFPVAGALFLSGKCWRQFSHHFLPSFPGCCSPESGIQFLSSPANRSIDVLLESDGGYGSHGQGALFNGEITIISKQHQILMWAEESQYSSCQKEGEFYTASSILSV